MATTGLLAICMTSCGGGGDSKFSVPDFCNKMQSCGYLSLVQSSTVSECEAASNQHLNAMNSSDRAAYEKEFGQCMTFADCATMQGCGSATILCIGLQGCNAPSLMGNSTTVDGCVAYANQQLVALDSSQRAAAVQALNACVGVSSECTSLGPCVSALFTH
jgi:hypothetical protein